MLIIVNCKLSDDASETMVDFKAEKHGDAAPPIPGPQSTGHYDPFEAWRCCHATWQMHGSHQLSLLVSRQVQPYEELSK
jgi:hypothetical protein